MRYAVLFLILFLVWLILTFDFSFVNIIAGIAASLITALLFGKYFVRDLRKFFEPKRYFWLFVYLFVFTWECLKANIDVAYRVLHPALPIKPGIVKVKLGVKSDLAKMMLANSITMTPGTISVDIVDDYLFVHWIYVSSFDPLVYSYEISGKFERFIKRIFD